MTTFAEAEAKCGVCGTESSFPEIMSTNTFGSPDLDTRPPEMQRSTMFAWVQRCPACGYCSDDIREARAGARGVVRSAEYAAQLNDPAYPELARSFLCKAIVDRERGDLAAATWALVAAAWTCDDSGSADQAVACRRKAAETLEAAEAKGKQVAREQGATTALLVDLLRRSGQLERAGRVIAERRPRAGPDIIPTILDFQSALIARGDTGCHTIEEALGEAD